MLIRSKSFNSKNNSSNNNNRLIRAKRRKRTKSQLEQLHRQQQMLSHPIQRTIHHLEIQALNLRSQ
jgi:hypothetical protein